MSCNLKSRLTLEEKDILIELICKEQLNYHIANNEYESDKYSLLELLKTKIRTI